MSSVLSVGSGVTSTLIESALFMERLNQLKKVRIFIAADRVVIYSKQLYRREEIMILKIMVIIVYSQMKTVLHAK